MKLLSTTTRVEAPFIIVNIAGFAFGKYSKRTENVVNTLDGYTRKVLEYFPNFVQSVEVTKVNGAVNTYSI